MKLTRVQSKTILDNTGNVVDIPILLVEKNGDIDVLWSLHRYFIKNRIKSFAWQDKLIQAVGLLLEYAEANHDCFPDPKDLFESFTDAVYIGTISEDGYDPSGLYWLPKRAKTARPLLIALSAFSDWISNEYGTVPLNPWRGATTYEERLNWAALINKTNNSFLGHLNDVDRMAETAKRARNVMQRRLPTGNHGDVKVFPEDKIHDLLWEGFKKSENEVNILNKYNWRDIAITILMHGGGLRESEPFHLWIHDVMPDPYDPKLALVRIYHPTDGLPPKDFKKPDGRFLSTREAYLRIKYGLRPRMKIPRTSNKHAGWKNPKMTDTQHNYMQVHWFPSDWGYLFMEVWKLYMAQRIREKIPDTHPFLLVSFKGEQHGDMYTIDSFRDSHERAVRRIGLTVSKMLGTTEHGHRHAYGQRLSQAVSDRRIIQAGLHHNFDGSQDVYTVPTIDRITRELAKASHALENGLKLPMSVDIDALFN